MIFYNIYIYKPSTIISFTPKAGLLSSLNSCININKNRKFIHFFTGQVWANYSGLKRIIYKAIDKLIICFSFTTLCDSKTQSNFLKENLSLSGRDIPKCLGSGSIKGVDINKFSPVSQEIKKLLRYKIQIPTDSFVILYTGRICKDKGIQNLIDIFKNHLKRFPKDILICVGPNEDEKIVNKLIKIKNCFYFSFSNNINNFYRLSDLFIMPSFREGFGSAVIEASACGLPVIASDIPGLQDSVRKNVTGLLFPSQDKEGFIKGLEFFRDPANYKKYSLQSRSYICKNFRQEKVVKRLLDFLKAIEC